MLNFWEISCRQGAWQGKLYIKAPSEWEAGKQAEITLDQLGLEGEVVAVNSLPLPLKSVQAEKAPEGSRCLLCGQPAGEVPVSRRIMVSPAIKVPFFGAVRILGELNTRVCPHCGKPEKSKSILGYIPENWFADQAQILPFVGKKLKRDKEVNLK